MQRPDDIDIEASFNDFVRGFGGKVISDDFHRKPLIVKNADYFFEHPEVIVELKCLKKDTLGPKDTERFRQLIDKWHKKGLLSRRLIIPALLSGQLPIECKRDILKLVTRTLETAIRTAKHQIDSTKSLLSKPNARGLVLIANDGNRILQDGQFIDLIAHVMQTKFFDSCIDGFVYFTANLVSFKPISLREITIWSPLYRIENDYEIGDFVNALGDSWIKYYLALIGEPEAPVTQISDVEEGQRFLSKLSRNRNNV